MISLKNLLTIAGASLAILANAQTQDTINVNRTSTTVEKKFNNDKTLQEEKTYIIENNSQFKGNKILLETEKKYSFREKSLGKPADPKEPKNILVRKQVDEVLDYMTINEYVYDTLGRLTAIKKTENYEPGLKDVKKSAVYYAYNGKDEKPIKLWEDLNNDGKLDAGDKIKIYVSELDKWVSQGE